MNNINQDELIEKIKENWKNQNCNLCGSNKWSVSDKMFELREFRDGDLIIGNISILPVIPVTCSTCGNIIFLNPIVMGLLNVNKEN